MERKKKAPAVKPRAKAAVRSDRELDKASLKERQQPAGTIVARRWLTQEKDGTNQHWHHSEPFGRKHLTVDFIDVGRGRLVQQTYTVNVGEPGTFAVIYSVQPPGAGWKIHNDEPESHTVWRRPHKGDVP